MFPALTTNRTKNVIYHINERATLALKKTMKMIFVLLVKT